MARRRNAQPRTEAQHHARDRALAALATARREKIPLSDASKREGTRIETVKKYAASALRQNGARGRIRVTAYDRIARPLNILTTQGQKTVTVRDSRVASRIGEYLNAVRAWRGGDVSALDPFREKSFRAGGVSYPFITDKPTLQRLGEAGMLAVEGLYRSIQGD